MPAELSILPLGDDGMDYGWTCDECRKSRAGLTQPHAINSMRLHNRENHAQPNLDLTALAKIVLAAWDDFLDAQRDHAGDDDKAWAIRKAASQFAVLASAWGALTGLDEQAGLTFARACAQGEVRAHVAPF